MAPILVVFDPPFWWLPALAGEAEFVPTTDPEDAALMARVARGDESALQRLFDRWKLPLLSFFYRSLGSHADAEDLTLEVLVRLHRAAPSYQPTARFTTYLFRIAENLLRNEHRRRRRKPAQLAPPELLERVEESALPSGRRVEELEEVLREALQRLPERARTALLLVQQQQLGYAEAAAVLQTNENALRVLVHRARQQLKSEMEALS